MRSCWLILALWHHKASEIWVGAGLLSIGPLQTNVKDILIKTIKTIIACFLMKIDHLVQALLCSSNIALLLCFYTYRFISNLCCHNSVIIFVFICLPSLTIFVWFNLLKLGNSDTVYKKNSRSQTEMYDINTPYDIHIFIYKMFI